MAGLEELKKKLAPLFDAEKGFSAGSTFDPSDSCMVSLFCVNKLGIISEVFHEMCYWLCVAIRWWNFKFIK